MSKNFWKELKKPIMVLAPMADVTDPAFRKMFAKYGKPDITFTQFVSTDGLMSPGRERILRDLRFSDDERPIVAQVFGATPKHFEETAKLVKDLGFDGIDINMGCPEKKIQKQHACAALITEPKLAQEVVLATKEGAGDMPVSVKTRIGYNTNEIETWLPTLLEVDPVAVSIHARTKKEMSKVPARWDVIKRAVEIRDEFGSESLILGNGDINSLAEARERVKESGVDGVMIGRGVFGDPWFFNEKIHRSELPLEERFRVMLEHTKTFEDLLGDIKNFAIMKKHFKAYVEGFGGAKELRIELMNAKDTVEIETLLEEFLKKNFNDEKEKKKILV
jgi:nifR3 family TIM-barrel protein